MVGCDADEPTCWWFGVVCVLKAATGCVCGVGGGRGLISVVPEMSVVESALTRCIPTSISSSGRPLPQPLSSTSTASLIGACFCRLGAGMPCHMSWMMREFFRSAILCRIVVTGTSSGGCATEFLCSHMLCWCSVMAL